MSSHERIVAVNTAKNEVTVRGGNGEERAVPFQGAYVCIIGQTLEHTYDILRSYAETGDVCFHFVPSVPACERKTYEMNWRANADRYIAEQGIPGARG